MRQIYLDATPLIALGAVGELDILTAFDGELVIPDRVFSEVTTEPARTNVERLLDGPAHTEAIPVDPIGQALDLLGDGEPSGDAAIIGAVLHWREQGMEPGVVSDDQRVRTMADGLGATVTGTVGAIRRSVKEGRDADEAVDLVRRVDENGLHMTGQLREEALKQIEAAATDDDQR